MRRVGVHAAPEALASHAVLDVRPLDRFLAGHLAGSGHLPAADLRRRRSELPPRDQPLLVVASAAAEAEAAAAELEAMGYTAVAVLDQSLERLEGGLSARGAAERLWRPAPYLEWALARYRERIPAGPAADVASGAGREAVFLALNGFEVEALDHDPHALERAVELAGQHGVRLTAVPCDLERPDAPLAEGRYALIVCFRFLYRPLLPRLAAALADGGVLIYETYRRGQERFGRPLNRRHLLEPGELEAAFRQLEVLHSEEPEPDEGPITSRLTARRR